jgi:hypothetical protein
MRKPAPVHPPRNPRWVSHPPGGWRSQSQHTQGWGQGKQWPSHPDILATQACLMLLVPSHSIQGPAHSQGSKLPRTNLCVLGW